MSSDQKQYCILLEHRVTCSGDTPVPRVIPEASLSKLSCCCFVFNVLVSHYVSLIKPRWSLVEHSLNNRRTTSPCYDMMNGHLCKPVTSISRSNVKTLQTLNIPGTECDRHGYSTAPTILQISPCSPHHFREHYIFQTSCPVCTNEVAARPPLLNKPLDPGYAFYLATAMVKSAP